MKEIKKTPNASKLFNRILECENDLKELNKSNFKLIDLNSSLMTSYLKIRSKLRSIYERIILEEGEFSLANGLEIKLWEDCYERPIEWIQSHLEQAMTMTMNMNSNSDYSVKNLGSTARTHPHHLRNLRNLLIYFIDEGSAFYQLILRGTTNQILQYYFMVSAAVLLHKRETLSNFYLNSNLETEITNYLNTKNTRSFALLKEAINQNPFRGLGYLKLAEWAESEGDNLLSMYWALVSCNVVSFSLTETQKSLEFLKGLAKAVATSPSFQNKNNKIIKSRRGNDDNTRIICDQLLQMAAHALLSQLTGQSHLRHLDQLSHSQCPIKSIDFKTLRYGCDILWMILGMEALFHQSNGEICSLKSCLLAKLFQIHCVFIDEPEIRIPFLAFSSNPRYSRLFTGNNYKIISKINNFTFESLNNLLEMILISSVKEFKSCLSKEIYLDYLSLETFSQVETFQVDDFSLINYFLKMDLYYRDESCGTGLIMLSSLHEKAKRNERSMKLLTHRLLTSKLESLEATVEPIHLPWTISDYPALLSNFPKIKRAILGREARIIITLSILQELDADKMIKPITRDIIRFLHERVEAKDPCVRLQSSDELPNFQRHESEPFLLNNYRYKIYQSHFESVKKYLNDNDKDELGICFRIICADEFAFDFFKEAGVKNLFRSF